MFYGDKKDVLNSKHIFNDRAWIKAKNTLKEMLMGHRSDSPNTTMFIHQLNKHDEPKKDSMGLFLYHIISGTNLTELYHKSLVSTYGMWKMGIEFSD